GYHRVGRLPCLGVSNSRFAPFVPRQHLRLFGQQFLLELYHSDGRQSDAAIALDAATDWQGRFSAGSGNCCAVFCRPDWSAQPHRSVHSLALLKASIDYSTKPALSNFTETEVPSLSLWIFKTPACSSVSRLAMLKPRPWPCCSCSLRSNCM